MTEPLRLTPQHEPRRIRRRGPAEIFSVPEALQRADEILAGPCVGHLPRVEGRGQLAQRFALPLELLRTSNLVNRGQAWAMQALKERVRRIMWIQCPTRRLTPLPGRPLIRAIRFSSVEPDALNDGFKIAIDFLTVPRMPRTPGGRIKHGLGFLVDDAPRYVEIASWWERAPKGEGMGILEIWTGEERRT